MVKGEFGGRSSSHFASLVKQLELSLYNHSDLSTTQVYLSLTSERIRDAVSLLDKPEGGKLPKDYVLPTGPQKGYVPPLVPQVYLTPELLKTIKQM